jgi:hypothetical protein
MRRAHPYLGAIILLHAAAGALSEAWFWNYVPDGGSAGDWMINPAIYWILLCCLIFFWCKTDASQRKVQFPVGGSMLVALVFPVGVPYYFFRTYSRRLALVRSGQFFAFVAACVAAFWLGNELTHRYYAVWTNK